MIFLFLRNALHSLLILPYLFQLLTLLRTQIVVFYAPVDHLRVAFLQAVGAQIFITYSLLIGVFKVRLVLQLQQLEVQKDRLTLRAPEDGKVLKLLAKQGEIVQADTPVILLESKRQYYDIYVSEKQAVHLHEGQDLAGVAVSDGQPVAGTIRFINQAPGFADLKETREKGQADLTAFQIRIYTDPGQAVRPGQTIEVTGHELPET